MGTDAEVGTGRLALAPFLRKPVVMGKSRGRQDFTLGSKLGRISEIFGESLKSKGSRKTSLYTSLTPVGFWLDMDPDEQL